VQLELTPEGHALLEALFQEASLWLQERLAPLPREELESLLFALKILRRIRTHGLISFVSAMPVPLVSPWAGIVADQVPKRNLLLLTQSTMMALVLSALAFPGRIQPWHIVALSFLLGLANTFDAPACQAFVIELVGREDLMNAIALNSALFNSARIIGPSLAGIVLAAFGPAWCFLLNGISFLAVIFGLTRMRVSDHPGPGVEHSPLTQLREGFQYVWRHRTVRRLIFMVAVSNLFASGYSVLLPAFARDVLGGSEITLGLLTTAVGVGSLLVAVLRRPGYAGLLLRAASLLFPGLVVGLAFASQLPLAMLLLVGIGVGFAVQNALANTMIQHLIPDALRGRVMSFYTLVFFGLFPVGALLSGGLAQALGVSIRIAMGGGVGSGSGDHRPSIPGSPCQGPEPLSPALHSPPKGWVEAERSLHMHGYSEGSHRSSGDRRSSGRASKAPRGIARRGPSLSYRCEGQIVDIDRRIG